MSTDRTPRARRPIGWCVTACALGLTALYLWVGDLTTLGESVTVWPSVGWVALLLAPAVVSRRPMALGSLLALLLLTTEWPRLSPAKITGKPDLRVAVWNVAGNPAAFDALAEHSPNVVLVQECVKPQRGWAGYSWHPALDPAILSRLPVAPLPTESIISLAPLRAGLRDVWPEAGVGWGGTAPEFLPIARIDQSWVSGRLRPLRARLVRLPGSDHRALLVDLALNAV